MKRVLIIDDSVIAAAAERRACEDVGYVVETAHTLDGGIELLREANFDCIVLDLGLPDSEGGTATVLRIKKETTLPIVVITASDNRSLAVQCIQCGATDYIVKETLEAMRDNVAWAITKAIARAGYDRKV